MFFSWYFDLERPRVVARPVAGGARRVHARQEEQLDHHEALALAGLASALGDVEREPPRVVLPRPRLLGRGEELADAVEQAGVGRQVGARGAADRLLVHQHQPADALHPFHDTAAGRLDRRRAPAPGPRPPAPPPRAPGAAATSSTSAWLTRLDLPEPETPVTVVNTPSGKATSRSCRLFRVTPSSRSQPLGCRGSRGGGRRSPKRYSRVRDSFTSREPLDRPAVEHLAPVLARVRPDVHDPVGVAHDVELVLDDEDASCPRP